ncbi:RNA polymerase sigma factor [Spirosoma aerophilum]
MTSNYSIESILGRVIQGDQAAFAKLYRHYRAPALKFCIYLVKDREEAENMIHDVFIKIWERRIHIKPTLNFSSYLFTCLRNMAFDYLKQVEKSQLLRQRYMEQMQNVQEEPDDQEARLRLLDAAINSLSEKRKIILLLNVEGGKSYQEIAVMMRISKNTVKNQLVKARQLLREKLDFPVT